MLHKWDHTVCDLLGLAFSIQPNSVDIYPSQPVLIVYSYSLLYSTVCMYHTLSICQLMDIWVVSVFSMYSILNKAAMNFCVNTSFISLG